MANDVREHVPLKILTLHSILDVSTGFSFLRYLLPYLPQVLSGQNGSVLDSTPTTLCAFLLKIVRARHGSIP